MQRHCIMQWPRYRIAAFARVRDCPQEVHAMDMGRSTPLCTPDPAMIGYTFVRQIGFVLDELSSQGLEVWLDEQRRWYWRWSGSMLQSERGFWALGEAVVDALVSRYPAEFACTAGGDD
jgi:hypothetical protein